MSSQSPKMKALRESIAALRAALDGKPRPGTRRRYRAHHIGRLRVRAAAILAANFPEWDVRPEDIHPATGAWRTDRRLDVYRWELFSRLKRRNCADGSELPVVCGCWDTLTLFVSEAARQGCHLSDDGHTIYVGKGDA